MSTIFMTFQIIMSQTCFYAKEKTSLDWIFSTNFPKLHMEIIIIIEFVNKSFQSFFWIHSGCVLIQTEPVSVSVTILFLNFHYHFCCSHLKGHRQISSWNYHKTVWVLCKKGKKFYIRTHFFQKVYFF